MKKKFRVWCEDSEQWVDRENIPATIFDGEVELYDGSGPWHFQQYIGFEDKNGKEIYEGDIFEVQLKDFNDQNIVYKHLYVIDYYSGSFLTPYAYRKINDGDPEVVGRVSLQFIDFDKLEIIGNIYENPDLIKIKI